MLRMIKTVVSRLLRRQKRERRPASPVIPRRDPVAASRRMLRSCRGVLTAKEAGLWR